MKHFARFFWHLKVIQPFLCFWVNQVYIYFWVSAMHLSVHLAGFSHWVLSRKYFKNLTFSSVSWTVSMVILRQHVTITQQLFVWLIFHDGGNRRCYADGGNRRCYADDNATYNIGHKKSILENNLVIGSFAKKTL